MAWWVAEDERWYEATRPLVLFLATPRTWEELSLWCKAEKISESNVRNGLAWLDSRHEAWASYNKDQQVVWQAIPIPKVKPHSEVVSKDSG